MKHYQESVEIEASPHQVFAYADNHKNFSSHMNSSSWMMGGGKMETHTDEGQGKRNGSHIKMSGTAFGIPLFLDEVVTIHTPPSKKEWQTVGKLNLLVIDHYTLGFNIKPAQRGSLLTVYINYNLPKSLKTKWLGVLFSKMYAKWCVQQMTIAVRNHFNI